MTGSSYDRVDYDRLVADFDHRVPAGALCSGGTAVRIAVDAVRGLAGEPPTPDAALLRQALRAARLSRMGFARALDVEYSNVYRWLSGAARMPRAVRRIVRLIIQRPGVAAELAAVAAGERASCVLRAQKGRA